MTGDGCVELQTTAAAIETFSVSSVPDYWFESDEPGAFGRRDVMQPVVALGRKYGAVLAKLKADGIQVRAGGTLQIHVFDGLKSPDAVSGIDWPTQLVEAGQSWLGCTIVDGVKSFQSGVVCGQIGARALVDLEKANTAAGSSGLGTGAAWCEYDSLGQRANKLEVVEAMNLFRMKTMRGCSQASENVGDKNAELLSINLDSSEFKDGLGVHAIAALLHLFGYTGPWDLGREGLRAAWRDTRRTALAPMAQLTQRAADRGNGARLGLVDLRGDAFTSADQVAAYWVFCLRTQCVPDGPHPRDQRQILTVSSMLGRL